MAVVLILFHTFLRPDSAFHLIFDWAVQTRSDARANVAFVDEGECLEVAHFCRWAAKIPDFTDPQSPRLNRPSLHPKSF